ncbi:MAG: phosphatidylserine/phosphatidylglycerophosphate/cardiolipin synthase family protein, partial [bacterium]
MLKVRDFSKRDVESGRLTYALHSKIVLVDGSHCYIGSANVTQASLRMNLEIGVVLHGKSVEQVQTLTEQIWEVSVPVPL